MKKLFILLLLMLTSMCFGRLGESRKSCINLYGADYVATDKNTLVFQSQNQDTVEYYMTFDINDECVRLIISTEMYKLHHAWFMEKYGVKGKYDEKKTHNGMKEHRIQTDKYTCRMSKTIFYMVAVDGGLQAVLRE